MVDPATADTQIFRQLQRHLDRQPIGFPATASGVELKVLRHLFSPEQARIAMCLNHKSRSVDQIFEAAEPLVASKKELVRILDEMVGNGAIETGQTGAKTWYRNAPLVVGMYEYQLDRLTPAFIRDFAAYTACREYGIAFLSVSPPQMRTIPVNKSIRIESQVRDFDRTVEILKASGGPFAVCDCICRKKQGMLGSTCQVTDRTQTCLAIGDLARTAVRNGMGQALDFDGTVAVLERNQKEGLVIQPGNSRNVGFICSCCGCCCGMLRLHKKLPRPLDFWVTNHVARIDGPHCSACGICLKKCQVDAVVFTTRRGDYRIDANRCIGCGICVAACPQQAVTLDRKDRQQIPPQTRDDLLERIAASKKGRIGRALVTGKLIKDALITGRMDILKPK